MTLLTTERELSRTQFKSMVVMVWHVVEEVCKDEAVQILGVKKYDTMSKFWCMALYGVERFSVEFNPPLAKILEASCSFTFKTYFFSFFRGVWPW